MRPLADDFFAELEAAPSAAPEAVTAAAGAYLEAVHAQLLAMHDRGDPAHEVNEAHADGVDRLIRKLFRLAEDRFFRAAAKLKSFRLAVVALGGYGRRELSLASDIDLLFLHRGKLNPYVETLAEAISYRLWDARLVVGAATRTVSDCLRLGREDLATLTSYLDARFLVGDAGLFAELERDVQRWIRRDPSAFIDAKLAEQRARHERFGESLYLLQPNVREGVGGLRDYHTALWVARAVQWEVGRPEHLRLHGFIDDQELAELLEALDFMWRVRNELHRSGRKDDRMHFGAQEQLAARLGFPGSEHALGVEQLMRSYYRHARAIQRASQRAIDHTRALDRGRRRARRSAALSIEEGFALVDGRLEIPHADLLRERPARIFAAFALAQRHAAELSTRAERLLRQHLHLIDDRVREDPELAALFREIIGSPNRVYRTLALMNELGVLGAYLPEFQNLVGLWQHDLYHTYTVDVHSLFLIEQLRRLTKGRFAAELPLATELGREIDPPLVIYLGCLLHDIGKGRGGGHSAKGAALVPGIGKRLGLSDEQTADVEFLVRHHLTLSALAEGRDVDDPRLILNLARLVETRSRLRSLYLLTLADIRSVSAVAWTSWKGTLLETLYRNVAEWLEAGVEDASAPGFFLQRAAERAERSQAQALTALAENGIDADQAVEFLDSMPRRYLLSHHPYEIAQHVRAALGYLTRRPTAAVSVYRPELPEAPYLGLVVLAADRPGLFATLAGVLHACGHNILGAQVYTSREHVALDIFQLAPIHGGSNEQEAERARIEQRLAQVLEERQSVAQLLSSAPPRARPPGRAPTSSVRISNDESDFYSIVDVSASDRRGLLYDITRTLSDFDLDVVMSRIATRASQVTDSFYVTDRGHKISDPERQHEIEAALLRALQQAGP